MTPYEIPLSPSPQTFQITLAGITYWLTVHWNRPANVWLLDVAAEDKTPLVSSIAIVCGVDLFEQFYYLGFGGMLIAQTDHNVDAPPTLTNLGKEGHLYFVV